MTEETKKQKAHRLFRTRVGKKLISLREDQGLSREQLAHRMNTTAGQLAHYETGRRLPGTPMVFKLCKALGVTSDYLLGLSNENTGSD